MVIIEIVKLDVRGTASTPIAACQRIGEVAPPQRACSQVVGDKILTPLDQLRDLPMRVRTSASFMRAKAWRREEVHIESGIKIRASRVLDGYNLSAEFVASKCRSRFK
jgi:hypothetical protein